MDPNLLQWRHRDQSFLSRVKTWFDLLDPSLLLSSKAEILKAHDVVGGGEKLNEKGEAAVTLSLSSFHPDSGAALPLIFRPPAFFPVSGPLVVASFLPHSGVKTALFWQFLLQSYNAGFSHVNRNTSAEKVKATSLKHLLLIASAVSYTTVAGALPQIFINRLRVRSPPLQMFCRSILPIPLSAALAFLSVFTVRNEETETGIQVFDSDGNLVGVSRAAGEKAVWDTALSRAALFGTTAAVPNLLILLLQRTRFFQRNSLLVAPCRHISAAFVLCLMIPVSFSLFSQVGTIKRESAGQELLAGAPGEELYYHRGL
ncbi:sideroflexin-4 [Fundulus heteroclitus]|uniref:sideroflexin-4 n=1 Tax=Fundulus heteroclitus TaxID=8078 RepID=UPI00165A639A|nr:sideroflexin-4 [Fundulus heteroclitus]